MLKIRIPVNMSIDEIKETLLEHDDFIPAITDDIHYLDDRALYVNDTFEITELSKDNDVLKVDYTFQWEAHYGCRDLNIDEIAQNSITARLQNDVATFELVSYEERSPRDEL